MNRFSRVMRRAVFATTLGLVLVGSLLPLGRGGYTTVAVTRAGYGYEEEITYYSDASLTTEVGWGHIYCNGHGTLTGTSTPYHTEDIVNVCCGSVPC